MCGASSADHACSACGRRSPWRQWWLLGWAVGKGSTPVDDWFHQYRPQPCPVPAVLHRSAGARGPWWPARWSSRCINGGGDWRSWRLMSSAAAIGLVRLLKPLFGRESGGALAYPSGHTTTMVVVMGMVVLVAGAAVWAVLVAIAYCAARHDRAGRLVPLLHRHGRRVCCWARRSCASQPAHGSPDRT